MTEHLNWLSHFPKKISLTSGFTVITESHSNMMNPVSPFCPPLSFSSALSPGLRRNSKTLRMRLLDVGDVKSSPPRNLEVVNLKAPFRSMILFMPLQNHKMSKHKACSSPQIELVPLSSQSPSLYPHLWCSLLPEYCSNLPPHRTVTPLRSGPVRKLFSTFSDLYNDWYSLTFLSDSFSNCNNFLVLKWFYSVFIGNNI